LLIFRRAVTPHEAYKQPITRMSWGLKFGEFGRLIPGDLKFSQEITLLLSSFLRKLYFSFRVLTPSRSSSLEGFLKPDRKEIPEHKT